MSGCISFCHGQTYKTTQKKFPIEQKKKKNMSASVTLGCGKQALLWSVCDQEMCAGQKIRVMLNEAYTTVSPLSFTGLWWKKKIQSWPENVTLKQLYLKFKVQKQNKYREHNGNARILKNYLTFTSAWEAGCETYYSCPKAPASEGGGRGGLTCKQLRAAAWSPL